MRRVVVLERGVVASANASATVVQRVGACVARIATVQKHRRYNKLVNRTARRVRIARIVVSAAFVAH